MSTLTRRRVKEQRAKEGRLVRPAEPDAIHPDSMFVLLSFKHWCRDRWCVSQCSLKETKAFAKRLQMMSQMTWGQLKTTSHENGGWELIRRPKQSLPDEAPKRSVVRAIRIDDKVRLIGYESNVRSEGHCFQVVAVARDNSWYDH